MRVEEEVDRLQRDQQPDHCARRPPRQSQQQQQGQRAEDQRHDEEEPRRRAAGGDGEHRRHDDRRHRHDRAAADAALQAAQREAGEDGDGEIELKEVARADAKQIVDRQVEGQPTERRRVAEHHQQREGRHQEPEADHRHAPPGAAGRQRQHQPRHAHVARLLEYAGIRNVGPGRLGARVEEREEERRQARRRQRQFNKGLVRQVIAHALPRQLGGRQEQRRRQREPAAEPEGGEAQIAAAPDRRRDGGAPDGIRGADAERVGGHLRMAGE